MSIERTEGPLITKIGEFVYFYLDEDGNKIPVRKEQEYIKEYHSSKTIVYRLSATKERILKINDNDMIAVYNRAGRPRKRDDYPIRSFPTSANIGSQKYITRTFAKNKISDVGEIIEVVEKTNSTIFDFVELTCFIALNYYIFEIIIF